MNEGSNNVGSNPTGDNNSLRGSGTMIEWWMIPIPFIVFLGVVVVMVRDMSISSGIVYGPIAGMLFFFGIVLTIIKVFS